MVRRNEFINISRMGYTPKEVKKIIFYEILAFYATIILLPLPYIIIIGIRFIIFDHLAISLFIILVLLYLIPTLISIPVAQYIYNKIIITQVKGDIHYE
jgi:hypothetical protein